MTIKEAIKIMEIERTCVLRQDTPECNRDECGCQCCDLVQEPDDVVAAYDAIIKAAEAQAKIEEQTAWFKDALDKRQFNHEKEFFDGHCPYTDNFCSVWTCNDCEESKREKEASERVGREEEEAIKILSECKEKGFKYTFYTIEEYHTAIDMAIKALEKKPILNKIRAEIEHEREEAYIMFGHALGFDKIAAYDKCIGIIDKYKAESEDEE